MSLPRALLLVIAVAGIPNTGCSTRLASDMGLAPPEAGVPAATWVSRSNRALRDGDMDLAVTLARHAVSTEPGLPIAWATLGWALLETGFADQAERAFRQALQIDPGNRQARTGITWLYLSQERLDDLDWSISGASARFEDLHLRGAVLIYRGQFSEGKALLREAKSIADRRPYTVESRALEDVDCRLATPDATARVCRYGPTIPPGDRPASQRH